MHVLQYPLFTLSARSPFPSDALACCETPLFLWSACRRPLDPTLLPHPLPRPPSRCPLAMGYATRSKASPAPAKAIEKAKPAAAAAVKAAKPVKKASAPAGPLTDFPDVPVLNDKGEEVMSASVCADTHVVVFLYPKANTPGCTKQACGLNDNYAKLKNAGFRVVGLSYDSPKSQTNWASKYGLHFSFLCDTKDGGLIKKLGCNKPPKSIKRSHFVVQKGGKILDTQIQISPGDSIARAVQFVEHFVQENGAGEEAEKEADKEAKSGADPEEAAEASPKEDVEIDVSKENGGDAKEAEKETPNVPKSAGGEAEPTKDAEDEKAAGGAD